MSKRRITLSGYYGFKNAGDEAVLAGIVKGLREQPGGADLDINVLSIDPAETMSTHGVRAANRYKIGALLKSLMSTDLLLSGGGSLLQDVTSAHGIFYYAGVVRIAQMIGKKTMFIGQGIGPLNLPRSRSLVAGIANRLDAVTVRDPESLELLKEIGVTRPPMEVTADPALLLAEPRPITDPDDTNRLVVSLRPWHSGVDDASSRLVEACAKLTPTPKIATLAMQPQQDGPVMRQFQSAWEDKTGGSVETVAPDRENRLSDILFGLSYAEMVVAMRLHALILAAGAGVPSVALSYDPKVTSFMRFSGQEDAVVDVGDTKNLEAVIRKVWDEREERAARLRERLPAMRAAAMRNAEIAVGLLRA